MEQNVCGGALCRFGCGSGRESWDGYGMEMMNAFRRDLAGDVPELNDLQL